jgi:hypothetical protein
MNLSVRELEGKSLTEDARQTSESIKMALAIGEPFESGRVGQAEYAENGPSMPKTRLCT